MVASSTPPRRDISTNVHPSDEALDPDGAKAPVEPVRPSEGPRQQALKMTPPPSKLMLIGGGIAAAMAGGAVGFWLGNRRAQRPARPIRNVARTAHSAMELVPVAMHVLANPLVRAFAMRMLLRQISRRTDH